MLSRLHHGITDNHWIKGLRIAAVDDERLIRAAISVEINWATHRLHLEQEGLDFELNARRWNERNIHRDVDLICLQFNDVVSKGNLETRITLWYTDEVMENPDQEARVDRTLGFSSGTPYKWAGTRVQFGGRLSDLDEVSIKIEFVDDEGDEWTDSDTE